MKVNIEIHSHFSALVTWQGTDAKLNFFRGFNLYRKGEQKKLLENKNLV